MPIIEAYPTLAAYPEFANADDRLLAYVIWATDKGSPLINSHKEPIKRREEALVRAGFKRNKDGSWVDPRCEDIINRRDQEVASMTTCYLRYVMASREFAFWLNGNEMVWQNIDKIAMSIEGEQDEPTDAMSAAEAKKTMAKGEEKEKDIQAAYNTRNSVFKVLPEQMKTLDEYEKTIFPDADTKEMVTDYVNQINARSVEKRVLNQAK